MPKQGYDQNGKYHDSFKGSKGHYGHKGKYGKKAYYSKGGKKHGGYGHGGGYGGHGHGHGKGGYGAHSHETPIVEERPKQQYKDIGHIDDYDDYPMSYLDDLEKEQKKNRKDNEKEERKQEDYEDEDERDYVPMTQATPVRPLKVISQPKPMSEISAGFVDSWHSEPKRNGQLPKVPLYYTSKHFAQPMQVVSAMPPPFPPKGFHPFSGFYHKNKFNQ